MATLDSAAARPNEPAMNTSFTAVERPGRVRWALRVRGTVQGVGFRPAVHRLALRAALGGLVRNDADGVWIEVEGDGAEVARFANGILAAAPPRARIDSIERLALQPIGEAAFRIVPSTSVAGGGARRRARVPADGAPCADCLRELFDPADRRYRYPFINCTACGPRYTIVADVPYDRARTTMAPFILCRRCQHEYDDPEDRRFHAEPNACPACGPQLRVVDADGTPIGHDPLAVAGAALRAGAIVALQGVGGFQLAVDARDDAAVARLRLRKRRPHKPFALMARDLDEVRRIARLCPAAEAALLDAARPIVLVPARAAGGVAPSVAPALGEFGVMLPSTPLHQLLLADGPSLLVMTSGNRSDEPLALDEGEARSRLGGIADLLVSHDRAIHTRVDDSVVRVVDGSVLPLRRARGLVPDPMALPVAGPPLLAVGGELKSTVCLVRDGEAFLSQHLGDLSNPSALAWFEETIEKLQCLVGVAPTAVAHDLHPDYRSTRWALARGLPRTPVQHHHAHVAACLAEHGRLGPAIGVAFDGTGCGPAGELWGGELLVADLGGFRRLGHLRPLALAGGEAAIRQPWRLALAALRDADASTALLQRIAPARLRAVDQLLHYGGAARATSAGRWFDAVAALAGLRDEISYDAQAAIELEAQATLADVEPYPFAVEEPRAQELAPFSIDLRPMVRALVAELESGAPTALVASRFHETMAQVIVAGCLRARVTAQTSLVALSGGCFANVRLSERARVLLERAGFAVLLHRRVPPNDGGLAFGQAAIASFRSSTSSGRREVQHVSRNTR